MQLKSILTGGTMEQFSTILESILDFVLGNIGIVIFALFLLSGLIGRNRGQEGESHSPTQREVDTATREQDDRPLAERLAEYFGVEVPEEQGQSQTRPQSQQPNYRSEGRRSTTRRNVQDQYPELFGGPSLFDRSSEDEQETKWGFDETEWGSTFEKNDEQWGNTFPDRKDSEPRIEWPR